MVAGVTRNLVLPNSCAFCLRTGLTIDALAPPYLSDYIQRVADSSRRHPRS